MRRPGSIPTYNAQRSIFGLTLPAETDGYRASGASGFRSTASKAWIGLGGYPVVTIDEARDKAIDNRRTVRKGGDPHSRQRSNAPTFEKAVVEVIGIHSPGWRDGGKTAKSWRSTLCMYAYPRLGAKPVNRITAADVMAVLNPIWHDKPETAGKVRQRISTVMNWSVAQGYRTDNPAGEAISAALPKRNAVTEHSRALPFAEVGSAVTLISGLDHAALATRLAFRFLVLTAVRSGEVRGARWDEIDVDKAVWTISGERMKTGREHRVPLSSAAVAVLDEAKAKAIAPSAGLVFPSVTGRAMSDSTLSKLLRENGVKAVPHGFRSSFRDWAAEKLGRAPRGRGNGPSAYRGQRHRAGIPPHRPVRKAPRTDARVGRLFDKSGRLVFALLPAIQPLSSRSVANARGGVAEG